jgi:hypothetical protein
VTSEPPANADGQSDDSDLEIDVDTLDDIALRRHVAKLAFTLRQLTGTVARLAGAPDHDGAEDRRDSTIADEELVAWVQWLVARYELDNIPDCWSHHGALVEELDALRVGWLDTIGKGQGGLAAMQWHDYFGRALERVDRRWRARNCEDTHRDTILPTWATADPTTLEAPDRDAVRYRRPRG